MRMAADYKSESINHESAIWAVGEAHRFVEAVRRFMALRNKD
jgi:hypothetical protein